MNIKNSQWIFKTILMPPQTLHWLTISNPSSENPQDHHCGSEVRTLDFQLKVHRIIVATILP
jgi:hypothetical protein